MHTPDLKNFLHEDLIEAGCDEAGRGPLAGPVLSYCRKISSPRCLTTPRK